jgi:hypothetical protein
VYMNNEDENTRTRKELNLHANYFISSKKIVIKTITEVHVLIKGAFQIQSEFYILHCTHYTGRDIAVLPSLLVLWTLNF